MKHYAKPPTMMPAPAEKVVDPQTSDISVDSLIDDGLLALYREIKNILGKGIHGKLDAATARDLRDHLKLLFEIRDRQLEGLKGLSDEQLKELLGKLNETK